jgi:hypothetical protein
MTAKTDFELRNLQIRLRNILDTMDVPAIRKITLDIGWLSRNIRIRNSNHPLLSDALQIIHHLKE